MQQYKTGGLWAPRIEEVEVERATDSSVWIKGRRCAKRTTYESYFDTWEQAHQYLITEAQAEVDAKRKSLQRANDVLGNIKGMKPPKATGAN